MYSAHGPVTKNKERIKWTIYQIELDKTSFQHDMAYEDFKNLTRRTASDKVLHDPSFNIAKNMNNGGNQCGLI